jgi:PleD family two-component response regulator
MSGPVVAAPEFPARILLVDDEPANLDLLRQALDGRSYRLLVATSGEDALKVARRARPSLVLLDVLSWWRETLPDLAATATDGASGEIPLDLID